VTKHACGLVAECRGHYCLIWLVKCPNISRYRLVSPGQIFGGDVFFQNAIFCVYTPYIMTTPGIKNQSTTFDRSTNSLSRHIIMYPIASLFREE
jgi:hypothetical protein